MVDRTVWDFYKGGHSDMLREKCIDNRDGH